MAIDFTTWLLNIEGDLKSLADLSYQAQSFSGKIRTADTSPGEMVATLLTDDLFGDFVQKHVLPSASEDCETLISLIENHRDKFGFRENWELTLSRHTWIEIASLAGILAKKISTNSTA